MKKSSVELHFDPHKSLEKNIINNLIAHILRCTYYSFQWKTDIKNKKINL